jgi:hypothetical protein
MHDRQAGASWNRTRVAIDIQAPDGVVRNIQTHQIPHKDSLNAKLLLLFYLLLGKRDIAFGSPCGAELTASGILRCVKVAEIGCVEKLCKRTQALAIDITVQVDNWLVCNHG